MNIESNAVVHDVVILSVDYHALSIFESDHVGTDSKAKDLRRRVTRSLNRRESKLQLCRVHNLQLFVFKIKERKPYIFKCSFFAESSFGLNKEHWPYTPINISEFGLFLDDKEQIIRMVTPFISLELLRLSPRIASFLYKDPLIFIVNIFKLFYKGPLFKENSPVTIHSCVTGPHGISEFLVLPLNDSRLEL